VSTLVCSFNTIITINSCNADLRISEIRLEAQLALQACRNETVIVGKLVLEGASCLRLRSEACNLDMVSSAICIHVLGSLSSRVRRDQVHFLTGRCGLRDGYTVVEAEILTEPGLGGNLEDVNSINGLGSSVSILELD